MEPAREPCPEQPKSGALGPAAPAFIVHNRDARGLPVVISVPHAGRAYEPELLAAMRDPLTSPRRLEDRHADTLALAVAREVAVPVIVAQAPRALIDLNRAEDDIDWGMVEGGWRSSSRHSAANRRARSGLGLIPRRLPGSGEIWRGPIPAEAITDRLERVHRPYHRELGALLEEHRDRWGAALLIDLHSMPPLRPKIVGDVPSRVVIGDRFGASCAPALSATALHSLAAMAWRASHNRPYAGGYVLDRHGQPRRRIHAMQVEICRASYLDADLSEPGPDLPIIAADLARLVRDLAERTAALGQNDHLPLAAE